MCGAEACAVGGALRAHEPFAFRTVVTTGASALRIQMPATAPPRGGHCSHRRRRAVTVRNSCTTRCSGPGRSGGAGQGRICRHSWPIGWPGWRNEMDCLHSLQTGAIKASLHQVGWTVTTPSVTAVPDRPGEQRQEPLPCARQPDLPKRAGVPPATTWSVQPEQSLALFAAFRQGERTGRWPRSCGHCPCGRRGFEGLLDAWASSPSGFYACCGASSTGGWR
jgi:hypothetical protein